MGAKLFITLPEKGERTDCLELQICENKESTFSEIISTTNIKHWKESSLYVESDNLDSFIKEYSYYFNNGLLSNLEEGKLDVYGINYFSVNKTVKICESLSKDKPRDFQVLVEFLNRAKLKNGFYILGL